MRGANRRRPTESFNLAPPPQQTPDLYGGRFGGSGDSDRSPSETSSLCQKISLKLSNAKKVEFDDFRLSVMSFTEGTYRLSMLKLSNDIHYPLNAEGSTPAEVMGIDYKSTLKPTLESFADEINRSCGKIGRVDFPSATVI
ncbi:hypothetical protein QYF36_005716 [Acer negundo]|nr:hypothetical protein QYF36_005716 [Acer negundo]